MSSHIAARRRQRSKRSSRAMKALAGLLVAGAFAATASAQIIDYCIVVKTQDIYGAGTDNNIYLNLTGTDGTSNDVYLNGSKERNETNEFVHQHQDIGIITRVKLTTTTRLLDTWSPQFMRIYRGVNCSRKQDADGWTEFSINTDMGAYDDPITVNASSTTKPKVTVSPTGQMVVNSERITVVNYASTGSIDQEVMKYSESWSRVDAVSVSSSQTDTVGAGVTVTYESPETVAGKFGAEASASWEQALETAKEESTERMSGSEFDWSFTAPAHTFVMRKVTFEIPYAEQVYASSVGQKFAVRKVGAQIRPVGGVGEFLEVPQRNADGSITPIGLARLQRDWFAYLDPLEAANLQNSFLSDWLSNGWVVPGEGGAVIDTGGMQPPVTQPPVTQPPVTQPPTPQPPTPTPQPPVVDPPVPQPPVVTSYTSEGVNGPNLARVSFGNGVSRFEHAGNGVWQEYNEAGQPTARFQETGRDDWSVYANDAGRNIQLQFDVHRQMIGLAQNGGAMGDQWAMVSAERAGTPSAPDPQTPASPVAVSYTTDGVTGPNLARVMYGGGERRFENTGNGVWQEFDEAGTANFAFQETGRDDWSVYATDTSRNMNLQLDVHRKMIRLGSPGEEMQDWTAMASAERVQ